MAASRELQTFLRQHKYARQFAWKATDDYLLARQGICGALWSGFAVSTQAIEKFLKAYLLFTDCSLAGQPDLVRKAVQKKAKEMGRTLELGHDVEAALALAEAAGLACSADLRARVTRINKYYAGRYPDNPGPTALSTDELHDVDEAVFEVWDAFKAINADYYYVAGLMTPVYGWYLEDHAARADSIRNGPFQVMVQSNRSFEDRREDLVNGIRDRISRWYPNVG